MKKILGNINTWYKADKEKKFYKRRWFITAIICFIFISFAGNSKNTTTTTTPVNAKVNAAAQAKLALGYANDEISMGLSGEEAIKSVMGGGVTRQEAITAINIVNAQRKDAKAKKVIEDAKVAAVAKAQENKLNTDIVYYSQVKAKSVFGDQFIRVDESSGSIIIYFKLSDNLSMKMVGDGGFQSSAKMFALYKGKTKNYTDVTCIGSYPMQDKYGKKSDSNIFAITLDKDTIQKTIFENIDPVTGLLPLSSSHGINPQLTN